jgi:tRNA-binding protein
MISVDDFRKVDIRVGRIVSAQEFPEARNPAYRLKIDFGPEVGMKSSSAQLVKNYLPKDLEGRLVVCVVTPRQVGPFSSEVLTLGVPAEDGECILLHPDRDVPLGGKMH